MDLILHIIFQHRIGIFGSVLKTKWVDLVDYLSRIYKDTDAIVSFNNYFWNKLHNVNHVEIIGWSAGEVDLPYLRKIMDNVDSSTIWNVYFYDDRALTMLSKAMDSEKISDLYEVHYIPANEFWN